MMKNAFIAVALLFSLACSARQDAQTPPGITGTITKITGSEVLVEEQPGTEQGGNKAAVRLTDATRVEGGTLAVGQRVAVWFAGPVMESYPVRGDAARIKIER